MLGRFRRWSLGLASQSVALPVTVRGVTTRAQRGRVVSKSKLGVAKHVPANQHLMDYCVGDAVTGFKTSDRVWSSQTIGDAWHALNEEIFDPLMLAAKGTNPLTPPHIESLLTLDTPALAKLSSRAELEQYLRCFPTSLRQLISSHPNFSMDTLEEVFIHVGQPIEVIGGDVTFMLRPPTPEELKYLTDQIGRFGRDGRGCIPGTLHRVSRWSSREGRTLGLTMRVGRYIPNSARALTHLAAKKSLLVLARPGAGKTTILRDVAVSLSRLPGCPRVVVVDTSNEIGGDGDIPLPYLGRVRRIQVPSREDQFNIMTQSLTNHNPDYLVIDEIATEEEAQAVWNMCQRGVRVVATCHGESLGKLVQNKALNLLVGGVAQAFLSNEERRLRSKIKKTILERTNSSPFEYVVELPARGQGVLYNRVNEAVDMLLDDGDPRIDRQLSTPIMLTEPLLPESLPGEARRAYVLGGPAPQTVVRNEKGYLVTPQAESGPSKASDSWATSSSSPSQGAKPGEYLSPHGKQVAQKERLSQFLDDLLGEPTS